MPAGENGWLAAPVGTRWRAGRGLWGAELVAKRNGCSAGRRAPGAGKVLAWQRSGPAREPAGRRGPPGSSLTGAGLSPERGDGVDFTLLSWFLGGSRRRRNMALVGNGAELEADEVLAGGG